MASVPQAPLARWVRGSWVAALLPLVALAGGCVTLDCLRPADEPPPPGVPCRVVAWWQPHVVFTPDSARQGVSAPGLAGRLYLFGPTIDFPQVGDGGVLVELYDDAVNPPTGKLLEQWQIDKDTLKRLLKKDAIGWGYTLFLPWGSYRPDITRVHLTCRYEPAKGTPLYADASPLTVEHEPSPAGAAVPAAAQVPAAPNALPMPRAVQ